MPQHFTNASNVSQTQKTFRKPFAPKPTNPRPSSYLSTSRFERSNSMVRPTAQSTIYVPIIHFFFAKSKSFYTAFIKTPKNFTTAQPYPYTSPMQHALKPPALLAPTHKPATSNVFPPLALPHHAPSHAPLRVPLPTRQINQRSTTTIRRKKTL